MRGICAAKALCAVAVALALGGPGPRAQEEPPLLPEEPSLEQATPTPTPTPVPLENVGEPDPPLRATLDFQRWQEMSPRERQTFVEGAVQALNYITARLRPDLEVSGTIPPPQLAAIVNFVAVNHPRHPPARYRREMDSIYMTWEGQKLSMQECFLEAFRRLNLPGTILTGKTD